MTHKTNKENKSMMNLNRQAEVSLHGQAADCEWTMERLASNDWKLIVRGFALRSAYEEREFHLTDAQASVTLALFIGELEDYAALNSALYEIAEEVWSEVEQHLRIIP